jgi:tetratricopeptide (TPR) repeat protein
VAPTNLEGQQLTYRLYQRTDKPAKEVIARAESMRAKYPDDPRFELLLAIAYGQSGDAERARTLLRESAKHTPPDDPQFVRLLSMVLDRNRMFNESQDLLERAVAERNDPKLLAILVQRLWQNGYAKEAAERLKDLDPKSQASDSELLALRALALFELKRADEAMPIVEALASRTSDSEAQAWSTALATRYAKDAPEPRAAIAQYRAALTRDPDNGVIRYMVGEAYERLGESEPALAAWRTAAELLPSWSRPAEKMARALAATGRTEEALMQAIAARRSAPHELSPAITYVVVAFKHLGQSNDPAKVHELLKLCESINAAQPNEPETLPIRVALLARKGKRDEAIGAARTVLSSTTTRPSSLTLLRLASISRTEKLGLEPEISSLIERGHEPLTPALALARATELAAGGKIEDGLKFLEDHAKSSADPDRAAAWQLVIAQYREQTRDPKAAAAWLTLGEAYPSDISVQTAILRSGASARADREFVARTIDRVKQLTGDEGTLWKIERARWLLGSDKQKDYADAVIMLGDLVRTSPTLIEPRLLLAAALEKVDNASGAIKELRVAADLEPRSTAIATELARLLQAQGKFDDARVYLDRVAKSDSLDPATRRHAAAMLSQQGDVERAITLLRAGASQNGLDPDGLLLLAQLQRRQGMTADAAATYEQILAQPPVDLDAVESAADFYASQGKLNQASNVLKLIDAMTLRPGMRELVLARFAERHKSPEAADKHYTAATTAAPGDVTPWRERVGFLLRRGRGADAVLIADEGLKALPDNSTLQTLRAYAVASAANGGQSDLQPLIDDLSKDPSNERSLKIARLLQEEAGGKVSKQEMAARFRQLADQFMRNKPLQIEAVRRSLEAGEVKRAAEIANRTMQAFPGDADVARLATNVYRQARDWRQMESAAAQWRARSLEHPLEADVAVAEARLEAGNPAGAVAQLAPHAASASASPEANASVIVMYARALAAAGREADARQLLEPLLDRSPKWRSVWIGIADDDVPDGKAAVAWLDALAPHVPRDDAAERLALARAWHIAGSRWQLPEAHLHAKEILVPMSLAPDADVDVYLVLASALQASGDLDAAEKNYRKALSLQPDNAAAQNNLAYLLLTREGGDLAEAETLAGKAVAAAPKVASFHDTLARVRMKSGNQRGALESFQNALEIDPDHIEAMIGKASVLAAMGQRAAVRDVLRQIDAALPRKPQLSPELKRELELARNTLSAAVDPR